MIKTPRVILVPTDFSEFSDAALRYALDIAAQYDATVYLLHVLGDKVYSDHTITEEAAESLVEKRVETARNLLKRQSDKAPRADNVRIEEIVRTGLDYEEILREQEKLGPDLIVIASHGRTGLLNLLMGSVAEKVAREAKCPVLLVRSRPPDGDAMGDETKTG